MSRASDLRPPAAPPNSASGHVRPRNRACFGVGRCGSQEFSQTLTRNSACRKSSASGPVGFGAGPAASAVPLPQLAEDGDVLLGPCEEIDMARDLRGGADRPAALARQAGLRGGVEPQELAPLLDAQLYAGQVAGVAGLL